VAKVAKLYEIIEKGSNPKAMIFPWLPNSAVKAKDEATGELYNMLSDIIKKRKEVGSKDQDALQVLIDLGDSTPDIVGVSCGLPAERQENSRLIHRPQFVLGTLFAGIINTGNNACWILLFLNSHPEWKVKATAEIKAFVAKYSNSSQGSLASRLSEILPSAWEEDMPVMEVIIRETIRLLMSGTLLRRNVKEDLTIDEKLVERGAFMAYPLSTLHFDSSIYADPYKFDPDRRVAESVWEVFEAKDHFLLFRYSPSREEDKKVPFGYVGWGVGESSTLK
jgi:cytochrome P450